jgi:phage-related holin
MLKPLLCAIAAGSTALLIYLIGGVDTLMSTFLLFAMLDWFIAIIAAKINSVPVTWSRAVKGLWKSIAYIILVIVAHRFDIASIHLLGFSTVDKARNALLIGLVGYELLSILRHAGACGCVAPGWLSVFGSSLKCMIDRRDEQK